MITGLAIGGLQYLKKIKIIKTAGKQTPLPGLSTPPLAQTWATVPPLDKAAPSAAAKPSSSVSSPLPTQSPKVDVYPEVWSKNGYDGASYEFKSNCGPSYSTLEECFLWQMTRVDVVGPNGTTYQLNKDFNQNAYSGEITRRWVLYGPAGAGLPGVGTYVFSYFKGDSVALTQSVNYMPSVVQAPNNITWRREGNDLIVAWQPPSGMTDKMWYKVIVFRTNGQVLSQQVTWNSSDATLKNFPLDPAEAADMNVSSYFPGGYAYPASIKITW